ncbi:hypothetical protein KV572_06665 [Pseudomonas yamanorum]|uniref:HAD family hydrolase n=1 Tax=Pseudomonas yamanorum TaxID=515393 RepID=UPI001C48AC45|nr:hypothetical protein [Pseudomonas yamanorum]MBV6660606.1 hypothetical protein [Pseudomonas yamanorum]
MRVIIFDLDLTLAATDDCHAYLRSKSGRRDVVAALKAGTLKVSFYGEPLVAFFNNLSEVNDCCVAVVSDSPKDYCLQVLAQGGYRIDEALVFGSQSKPLVDQEAISNAIAQRFGIDAEDLNFLIVGDSPKDIYYAHSISVPSIFAAWGSKQSGKAHYSEPTAWADNIDDLKKHVIAFLGGNLKFEFYCFKQNYLTISPESPDFVRVELSDHEIGFGKEYVKGKHRGPQDLWASNDLFRVVKQAKNLTVSQHNSMKGTPLYGANGLYDADPFKKKAGHFKNDFIKWCLAKKITGNVLLIPVPPSVPRECNLTHSMALMCDWWAFWINKEDHKMKVKVHDPFERYWPKIPSHLSSGWRSMDDQFDTLGVFLAEKDKISGADFVILVDDVVTSGSHMNAVASFIRTAKLVDEASCILGYALFKTIHIDESDDLDFSWVDKL